MITFAYDCPYCLTKKVGFEVANFSRRECDDIKYDIYAILATCNYCGKGIVANCGLHNQSSRDHFGMTRKSISEEIFKKLENHGTEKYQLTELLGFMPEFEPKTREPEIPDDLPDNVLKQIRSAEKLYLQAQGDEDMIEYAGTAYRKTIDKALTKLDMGLRRSSN